MISFFIFRAGVQGGVQVPESDNPGCQPHLCTVQAQSQENTNQVGHHVFVVFEVRELYLDLIV